MLTANREFVVAGQRGEPGCDVPEIEDPRFTIASGGTARTVRRTWLDTFDWRLFGAGLTLELVASRGSTDLVLAGARGELVARMPAGQARTRPPWLIGQLPEGQLRERIAPVVGVRALLPVARATSAQTELRALNTDQKTIAILVVDRTRVTRRAAERWRAGTTPGGTSRPDRTCQDPAAGHDAQPPTRLTIAPLRGYQVQAGKLAAAVARSGGIAAAATSPFEAALAAAGRTPGDYSSKVSAGLTATMPAEQALGLVLAGLFGTVEANLHGTIAGIDTEFLHDLRVAVRRTRSVLRLADSVLPASLLARYRPEFKWLGDLTTPARDFDVYLLAYPTMAAALLAADAADLLPFRRFLERQRAASSRQLARGLRSARFSDLAERWREELKRLTSAPGAGPATGVFAARGIRRAHQRILRSGRAISQSSPPHALHDLRKRCKELRYALEVFASIHDPAQHARAVSGLKALQEVLGEFQDCDVQIGELRGFADRLLAEHAAPARTLLAMGEIAAALAARQSAARQQFADRFAGFASQRGRARIEALTMAAQ